jgi:hypothetical protein
MIQTTAKGLDSCIDLNIGLVSQYYLDYINLRLDSISCSGNLRQEWSPKCNLKLIIYAILIAANDFIFLERAFSCYLRSLLEGSRVQLRRSPMVPSGFFSVMPSVASNYEH